MIRNIKKFRNYVKHNKKLNLNNNNLKQNKPELYLFFSIYVEKN